MGELSLDCSVVPGRRFLVAETSAGPPRAGPCLWGSPPRPLCPGRCLARCGCGEICSGDRKHGEGHTPCGGDSHVTVARPGAREGMWHVYAPAWGGVKEGSGGSSGAASSAPGAAGAEARHSSGAPAGCESAASASRSQTTSIEESGETPKVMTYTVSKGTADNESLGDSGGGCRQFLRGKSAHLHDTRGTAFRVQPLHLVVERVPYFWRGWSTSEGSASGGREGGELTVPTVDGRPERGLLLPCRVRAGRWK